MAGRVDGGYFFFFNDTATTEIYTLSLHDALPIFLRRCPGKDAVGGVDGGTGGNCSIDRVGQSLRRHICIGRQDRKSTRLNSSHLVISYAVFCLKKQNFICKPHHTI